MYCFGSDGTRIKYQIKLVAAVLVALVLVIAARNSVAGELDDLLLDREPSRMTPSIAYSPVPPETNCPLGYCECYGPNCLERSVCKSLVCFGPLDVDVFCSLMGCSSCVYDVATFRGKCSGGES